MVSKRTLGDIFCENVEDMAEAQLDVFLIPAEDNPKVSSLFMKFRNFDSTHLIQGWLRPPWEGQVRL